MCQRQLGQFPARERVRQWLTAGVVEAGQFAPTDRGTPHADTYLEDYLALTPLGPFGRPAEIADAVAFLASKDAGFITGANLPVSGGKVMF